MDIKYRQGSINDLGNLKNLAIKSWGQYQAELTVENWTKLYNNITEISQRYGKRYWLYTLDLT